MKIKVWMEDGMICMSDEVGTELAEVDSDLADFVWRSFENWPGRLHWLELETSLHGHATLEVTERDTAS